MTTLSDYGDDDEVYDPNSHFNDIMNELRREAESLKVDGHYSSLGFIMLNAAEAIQDLLGRNDELLDKLIAIEDVVSRALKNQ